MESEETPHHQQGGIYNYFQGATINHFVINNGTYQDQRRHSVQDNDYSDKQIARALQTINGDGKPIDMKQKWAGAYWYLRWACNFPPSARDFCERISTLPFNEQLMVNCELRNIRELTTLSFMNQNPCQMNKVKPSKNEEGAFRQCREVALALQKALENT